MLDLAEQLLLGDLDVHPLPEDVLDRARREAEALDRAYRAHRLQGGRAGSPLAVDAVPGILDGPWLQGSWDPASLSETLDAQSRAHALPRLAVALRVLRDPGLLTLAPPVALYLATALVMAATDARRVALYTRAGLCDAPVTSAGGDPADADHEAACAADTLAGSSTSAFSPDVVAVPVERWDIPLAVLVVDGGTPDARHCGEVAAGLLRAVLDRQALVGRTGDGWSVLAAAADWRVARLEDDLHAGALRDLQDLIDEVDSCRRQASRTRLRRMPAAVLNGRLGDIEARVASFDAELRVFCRMLSAPLEDSRDIRALLQDMGDLAAARWGIEVEILVTGEADGLARAHRIAILRVAEEALDNAQQHGRARHVSVALHVRRAHFELTIADDGRGFDVNGALARSEGYGLPGIIERVRLLGGTSTLTSRPGCATTVAVACPLWVSIAELPPAVADFSPLIVADDARPGPTGAVTTERRDRAAVIDFAGAAIAGLWPQWAWSDDDLSRRVRALAHTTGVRREEIALRALRDTGLLTLVPFAAIEATLALLTAVGGADRATLWVRVEDDMMPLLTRGAPVGDRDVERRRVAAMFDGGADPGGTTGVAVPVLRWLDRHAILVVSGAAPDAAATLAGAAAELLGATVDREALLRQGADAERIAVETAERRLARYGFDLHDGPLQEIAVLTQQLGELREEVADGIRHDRLPASFLPHLGALAERIADVDRQLRAFVESLRAPQVLGRPLVDLLEETVAGAIGRAAIDVTITTGGEVDATSNSQRIALLRVVQEAVSNARKHGGATKVRVAVTADAAELVATIADDGRGFDVAETVIGSASRGRRGLISMVERARMIGGTCRIDSAPGHPTRVTVALPTYVAVPEPAAEAPTTRSA